ncbi:MAG: hypothetical protein A3F18_04640 [Legionellales bacterium RIFCSPHIGHO2_12_FULL_37_14]|nr:MAG: hypothetical protein A3F18_04640 [Legionellales bacterium RIFCSPHIGHO2_12_FULL_37_14]
MHKMYKSTENSKAEKEKIKSLRGEARNYRDELNTIMQKVWDIDELFVKNPGSKNDKVLNKRRQQLLDEVARMGGHEKYKEMIAKIITLEKKLYGYSELNSNSPYVL